MSRFDSLALILLVVPLALAPGCACDGPRATELCDVGACGAHGSGICTGGRLTCSCDVGYSGARCDACATGYVLEAGECVEEEEPPPPCDAGLPFPCDESEARPTVVYAPPRFRAVRVPLIAGAESQASTAYGVNAVGQIAGTARAVMAAGGIRWFAFRFDEASGIVDVGGDAAITTSGLAINDDGLVTGSATWANGPDRAFVSDGESFEDVGLELGANVYSLGTSINDEGQIAAECEIESAYRICRYTPGTGWDLFEPGGGFALADDGTLVGLANELETSGFVRDDGGLVEIGPRSIFETMPRAISGNGRYVVALQTRPTATEPFGTALWIDRESDEPPIVIGDVDGRPLRDLYSQPWGVNDDGFAVGSGHDEHGQDAAWLFDPRRGEIMRLDALTELPGDDWRIQDARAIGDAGHIAATTTDPVTAESVALLLVPLDWPEIDRPPATPAAGPHEYDVIAMQDGQDGAPGSIALGMTASGDVLLSSAFRTEVGADRMRGAWWRDGELSFLDDPSGEWVVSRTSRSGTIAGSVWVRDEFSDLRTWMPFTHEGSAQLAPHLLAEGVAHAFGYDVDAAGEVLIECLLDAGPSACVRTGDGAWHALFVGQPFAMSEDGVVVGARADDAVIVAAGTLTPLELGAGATASAISDDGRYVAGVYGHAFVYDRTRELFDWLPDVAGDPATSGRVVPLAVNDEGVVVGTASGTDGHPFAFRYDPQEGELVRLDTRAGDTELVLREARDIDARGAIVANGVEPDGTERGVVLMPRD
ncbi:calcium-binding EGF-like domain-containing protein [Sandaracinus amylolyticus]|uniref:EGF-like domain-containing protein n=1 Tax=Sandaracinus amylolyticus TaxID=927083 RepID=A0A0F6VZJ8_9BACT|nr:calcium-binding EGF-like domain-containing protein [Sandaracinus amylolyticus]AKF03643.1 hypothetical protein DB32_000792 [Sandaracinus amylolyticus]